jgi:peptide-methionine (R)-S-oxide reductase
MADTIFRLTGRMPADRITEVRPMTKQPTRPEDASAGAPEAADRTGAGCCGIERTDAEWRRILKPEEYAVLREHGTERPGSSPLNAEKRDGTFVCAGCGQPLFSSGTKFESGSGWPSFTAPIDGAVETSVDRSWLMVRTEVHCARCGGHLGHVFDDGPQPTGLRYCMNGTAMGFEPS